MNDVRNIPADIPRGKLALRIAMIAVVVVLAAYLRIVSAIGTTVDTPIRADAKQYVAYALNLKVFGVYSSAPSLLDGAAVAVPKPDAARTPGYPLFLRAIMGNRIDTNFVDRVVMLQAWLGVLVVALGMALAIVLLGYWCGVGVGAALAMNPHMIVLTDYLLTETLYSLAIIVFVSIGAWALSGQSGRRRMLMAWLAGVMLAIACLIRPTLDEFALALILLALLVPLVKRFRRDIALLVVGWALVMTPWWIRNQLSLGYMSDPHLMVTVVHVGSYPDLMLDGRPETQGYPHAFDPRSPAAQASLSAAVREVEHKFVEQPGRMLLWYVIKKPFYVFKWTLPDGWGDIFTYPIVRSPWLSNPGFILLASVMRGLHWPLVLLGMLGSVLVFTPAIKLAVRERWRDSMRWLAAVQIFMIVVHVAGAPYPRYSVPFRPLLFILAMFSVAVVVRWLQSLRQDALHAEAVERERRALP